MQREEEKEENEIVTVKRRRKVSVSVVAFDIFGEGGDLESYEDLSWEDPFDDGENWSGCGHDPCASVRLVPDVTDVPVPPSLVVTELRGAPPCLSDWGLAEPQSFSFSGGRAHCCTVTQEEMRYEDSPVKAPPPSRMTPPTPLQNSHPPPEGEQGHHEARRAREKAPRRQSPPPPPTERQRQAETEEQRRERSPPERRATGAAENYPENRAHIKVDTDALARPTKPEDEGVCLRYILKYWTKGGSNIFKLFDKSEKNDHLVANRRRWMEHPRGRAATQERWPNEWHDIEYHGAVAKAPPCPERTLNTMLPAQSSSSAREDEGRWLLMAKAKRCL